MAEKYFKWHSYMNNYFYEVQIKATEKKLNLLLCSCLQYTFYESIGCARFRFALRYCEI